MKAIFQTSQFKKDFKRIKKRGKDLSKLMEVVSAIANREALEERHRDHALSGNWSGSRDCHIEPDWILILKRKMGVFVELALSEVFDFGFVWW